MNLDDLNDALDLEEKDFLWNPKITTPSAVLLLNFLTVSLKSVMKSLQKTASASWLILWKRTGSKMCTFIFRIRLLLKIPKKNNLCQKSGLLNAQLSAFYKYV